MILGAEERVPSRPEPAVLVAAPLLVTASHQPLGAMLVTPERRSPEYLAQFVTSEVEKWAVPIKASGVSVE